MELLKLMMFKSDFLCSGGGKCDDRVPPINLSQLPEFLLCKCARRNACGLKNARKYILIIILNYSEK